MTTRQTFCNVTTCVVGVCIPMTLAVLATGYIAKKELEAMFNKLDRRLGR